MGIDTIYYEIARRCISIAKHEESTLLWENSPLAVRSDKGIRIYEFSYNTHSTEKIMDFLETSIPSPKASPAKSLFTGDYLSKERSNIETTEMMLDPAFWPHNDQLNEEMSNVRSMKWSPKGFVGNNNNALTLLNDVGGTELFVLHRGVWNSIFDFSPILQEYFVEYMKPPENFEQLREAVYTVESSAICWAPDINEGSTYFVTAQKNSKILFWHIISIDGDIKAKVVGSIQCDVSEIVSMIWIPKKIAQFLLICSDMLGQIIALECEKENSQIRVIQSHMLWPHKDKMIADHLQYAIVNDKIIFICNKYRHLLVQMFDTNLRKLSQYLGNVNDYRITGICKSMDGIYLSTINTKIYKVNTIIEDENIIISLDEIETKDVYPSYELFGITFSPNNMMCVLGLIDTKTNNRKKIAHIDVAFLTTDRKIDSIIPYLLSNPSQKLTNIWDCIEIIRFRAMKLGHMPKLDYNHLYLEGKANVYKMKLYLNFIILFSNLRKQFRTAAQEPLELSEEIVREKILAQQAIKVTKELSDIYKNDGILTTFQMESLNGARMYLEIFSQKHKKQFNFVTNDQPYAKCKYEYICQCCNEILNGFTCKNNHINMFCSLSFTPIEDGNYLACPACNSTARVDLYTDKPMCVYCDLHLDWINV